MGTRFTGTSGTRRTSGSERLTPLAQFAARLRAAGATTEEVGSVVDVWDSTNVDERAWAAHVTDVELRAEIARVRAEHRAHTGVEIEPAQPPAEGVAVGLVAPDEGGSTSVGASDASPLSSVPVYATTVAKVLAWVGRDPERARVALDTERRRAEGQRSSLVERLQRIVDGSAR